MRYNNFTPMRVATPSTRFLVLGITTSLLTVLCHILNRLVLIISYNAIRFGDFWLNLSNWILTVELVLFMCSVIAFILSLYKKLRFTKRKKIQHLVRKELFLSKYGNPLQFKDGEILPCITCKETEKGKYELTITATSVSVEAIKNISSNISSYICEKNVENYAVSAKSSDLASNKVIFVIEDVTMHKELIIDSLGQLKQDSPTKIIVQDGTYIDLRTSGSMLVAGKTRSGKSTAIISMLLQVLSFGRDKYGSEIMIIDPKQAELSRLPHVYTLDENGDAKGILDAVQKFAHSIKNRQKILNDLSHETGNAVNWWDAGMHVSILFIDEYVSVRTMFPQKTSKESEAYCLKAFDELLRKIITMGASAGCYVIISIAEASVSEGGLPAMLRSAMSTKILLKPTLDEGRLMWESDKLKNFSERVYNTGDAWFSSTDGIHDAVSCVHFPILKIPEYKELGVLLEAYYKIYTPPAE